MEVDFEKEGLLEGLDPDERKSRRKLLEELTEDGFELEDLREAVEQDRLALLPVEVVLGGEPTYTAEEVADETMLESDFLERLWTALGMPVAEPDEVAYTNADVNAAKSVREIRATGLPEDGVLEIARAMSQSMATLAAAVGRVFGDAFMREGDNELDLARRYTEVAEEIAPHLPPTLAHVFAIQQREELRRAMVDLEAVSKGELAGSEDITVAFADLVGFTRLGESIPPEELGAVAARLGELASEVAEAPVRFVKTIGDHARLLQGRSRGEGDPRAGPSGRERGREVPPAARRPGRRPLPTPGRRLVRAPGQPGQQDHRQGPPGHRPGLRGGQGARRGRLRLVVRAQAQDQGHLRRGPVVPRAPRGRAGRRLTLRGLDVGALSPLAARAGGANCAYRKPA